MGTRTNIVTVFELLTRKATYLVMLVDLSSMSRHGPTERRHFIGIADLFADISGTAYLRASFDDIRWAHAQFLAS
jgi:hypothetical protein